MGISEPTPFKKTDKPKTRRMDRVDDEKKEEIVTKWYQKEPWASLLYHFFNSFGFVFLFFGYLEKNIILMIFGTAWISYIFFEDLPGLITRFYRK